MTAERFDVETVLSQLKDFQRGSVEHAFRQLYHGGVDRFLVADEVGLGKTLVARGLIAKAIDHLWDDVERIDVIYICSNAEHRPAEHQPPQRPDRSRASPSAHE